ncbi:MAG: AMP-binding protein [Methyloligella sp.]|nr:MAG: AMP-binding protein [Methyloligella sp.]
MVEDTHVSEMALSDTLNLNTETLSTVPQNNISHVLGRRDLPLIETTIPTLLQDIVARFPDNEAAVFCEQNIRWKYSEFSAAVDALAGGLYRLGFKKGDRLGIWSPNRYEWLLTQFATARLGIVLVNINPAYRVFELEYALNKVGCRGIIAANSFKSSNYVGMLENLIHNHHKNSDAATSNSQSFKDLIVICMGDEIPSGMLGFDEIVDSGCDVEVDELDLISNSLCPDDVINIQFTSGTTGLPKGACLTHKNIINNAHFVTLAMKLSEQDRLCIPVPFYHCFGMVMGTLGCVTKGAAMVVPGEGFEPGATLNAVSKEKCTALYGVPTMFVAQLDLPNFDGYDLSNLRTGIMAGAPCPVEVMKKVQSRMNMSEVTIAYGMTETSPVSFQSYVDDPLDKRVSSVGRIHPHVEVKIVDEAGETVPVGVQGELLTRGYSVMKGYWGDQSQTAATIDEGGWLHTGDLATFDDEGYCKITGRVKDMICRGGENIYPREIEEFLFSHPSISQAQVFGIPNELYGEVTCAWIIIKDGETLTEDEVIAFCKLNIAHFKVPAFVRFKEEFPMTISGKPQKFLMRDKMVEELSLQ